MRRAWRLSVAWTALLLSGLGVTGFARADSDEACPAEGPVEVHIEGCPAEGCASHVPIARMLAVLQTEGYGELALRRAEGRLLTSRVVTAATLRCEGGRLVAEVVPTTVIRKVDVVGQDVFRRKDLMKRIFLRSGAPIDLGDSPLEGDLAEHPAFERQVQSLLRLYHQAGLDEARVSVRATRVSLTQVDIRFRFDEGARERIDSVTATHVHRGGGAGADSRCPTITDGRLERLVGLESGALMTRTTERQVKARLRQAFQAHGFERPVIRIAFPEPAPGAPRVLQIRVETERCWLIRVWQRDLPPGAREDTLAFRWRDPLGLDTVGPLERGEGGFVLQPPELWHGSLPFGESGTFDRSEATRALDGMTRQMRARGYPFAELRLLHQESGDDRARASDGGDLLGTIDYLITTRLTRRIQHIRIEGAEALPVGALRGRMQTKAYGVFSGSGVFDEARVISDLRALEAYYRDRGYFRLAFADGDPDGGPTFIRESLPPEDPGEPRVFRYRVAERGFRVEMREDERNLNLVIRLIEGSALRIAEVIAEGFGRLDPSALGEALGLEVGAIYRPLDVDAAMSRLENIYRRLGHYRFQLEVRCRSEAAEGWVDCRDPSLGQGQGVTVRLSADEGEPVRIGSVIWRGNQRTNPHVLTRDLPKAGDLLDLDRVNQGLRLMRGVPVFNSVRVDIIAEDKGDSEDKGTELADLVVAVEESDARFLDVAAGLRSIQRANIGRIPRWAANSTGHLVDQVDRLGAGFGRPFALDLPDILLTTEVEYLDLHVGGDGEQLRIPFVAGFSLSEFLRLASFNPSYSWRRFLDSRMILTVRGIAELDRVTDPLDRLELGAEADLLLPIGNGMLTGLTARAGIIRLAVPDDPCVNCLTGPPAGFGTALPQALSEETTADVFCPAGSEDPACGIGGFRPQFSVGLRWRYDNLDSPLHPTRGIMLSASTSFILDRDRFALEPRFNQFLRWEGSVRGAVSAGDIILAGFLRYGGSLTFDQRFLPLDERFTLGGFNGLRGFSDNGICRYDKSGALEPDCPREFGGNIILNGSIEARVPLFKQAGFWLGFFIDFGALARTHADLHWASLRASGGLGVRWLLGNLIPVRVDVGFPLFARRCVAITEFGDCIREEPSAFHVDLLYPF